MSSKFVPGIESRAEALAGERAWRGEASPLKLDNGPAEPKANSDFAAKIAQAMREADAHTHGNVTVGETANVIAQRVGHEKSFSGKVDHVKMMVAPHLKEEGSFMPADPQKVHAAVSAVMNVVSPPPPKARGPGGMGPS